MRREGYRWLGAAQSRRGRFTSLYRQNCRVPASIKVAMIVVNILFEQQTNNNNTYYTKMIKVLNVYPGCFGYGVVIIKI
jgi:hypothetical protein